MNPSDVANHLERARRRDPEALAALCRHFYPKILRYMRYRTTPTNAEDLTGDVFLRVMQHIHRQTGSFPAWLYRIAANVVTDHYRRSSLRQTESLDPEQHTAAAPGNGPKTVQARMDIEAAMHCLTPEQREFIVLKFVQGLSNAEIAEITGKKLPALRALQFRALTALRAFMQAEENGDHE